MDEQEREEFSAFYEATWQRAVACAYAVTGELAAAEDAAQDAFSRAWPRWGRLQRYDDPAAWVCRVATNQALSRWRRLRTGQRFLARAREPEPAPPPDPDLLALTQALAQLPAAQRRAVVLHHLAGFRVHEVAAAEGVPEGTVKARLSRGRAALAGLLTDQSTDQNGATSHA